MTIYAPATAASKAAVAVVRVSGPRAGEALDALIGQRRPAARRATRARLRDGVSGEVLDDALVLWFPAPHSATGENVAELHLHGGRAVLAAVLAALGRVPGLRLAQAGEFTRRAFEAGKLDLTEVEGLADLIAADTEAQRRQALRQLAGELGRLTEGWRTRLISALAQAEAEIDFPDEGDVPRGLIEALRPALASVAAEIRAHLADQRGERLRDGLSIAIIGPPNAGKSSLLNCLAQREAAIVAATAGTTRDVVEVQLDLNGYPVTLADTAGLRDLSGDDNDAHREIEREGMRRALVRALSADLKLLVVDACERTVDPTVAQLADENTIVVANKIDLVAASLPVIGGRVSHPVSTRTGIGINALIATLEREVADRLGAAGAAAPVVTRARHREALADCVAALDRALAGAATGAVAAELITEDLRLAVRALGRITGRVGVDDILDVIFREFCIGK
ncbi:MAG: tRNA uridine-5-carboxymethylaminomethyl(34) synthesis GTPase MnmE [Alphaproteobacteria bacterium]|nr:tRNA uridine-5-carboxymethylaminomethyl(34) synthesis GTPase MnmE [Alphaproteobacteria bacterium]